MGNPSKNFKNPCKSKKYYKIIKNVENKKKQKFPWKKRNLIKINEIFLKRGGNWGNGRII